MFLLLGATVALASFFLASTIVSAAVAVVAPLAVAVLARRPASVRGPLLLGLRLAPPVAAAAVALGLVAPSYLAFEPIGTGEGVGLSLALFALAGLALLAAGLARAGWALAATSALARRWSGAGPVALSSSPVAAFRVDQESPVFAVVGVRRPRLFVSRRVLDALTPDEVEAAVAHERAHLAARDNLKRLVMTAAPDLLAFTPLSRRLEREWSRASEALADQRASAGGGHTAVALAAGLVKVARLTAAAPSRLPISALHDGGDVEARVRWLLTAGAEGGGAGRGSVSRAALLTGLLAAGAGLAAAAAFALPAVHRLVETAVRLSR